MNRFSPRRIVFLVLLLAALVWLIVAGRRLKTNATSEAVEGSTDVGTIQGPSSASTAPRPFGAYRKGGRTPVPRFVVAAPDASALKLTTPTAPPPRLAAGNGEGPRSKLPETPPKFQEMQRKVNERLAAFHEKADHCLAGYTAADPALQKGVMVGIELDGQGLQRVWIDQVVDVPAGPLRCLSEAVYQLDWTGISEKPLLLTTPERFESADAGAR